MIVVPVFRGEFGLKIRYHVPAVHAMQGPKVVEIEEGEEALYPSATEWVVAERADDDDRVGWGSFSRGMPEERFVPEPYIAQGVDCRVVICPRHRRYGAEKNWPHWHRLAELPGVFAAGASDSSYDVQCPRAWDYARFLDASIEAMRSASIVVATDAGLAHLAVLCGTPLLLVTHRGRVAPGPVVDSAGRVAHAEYWPVRIEEYYEAANHTGSSIVTVDGWTRPNAVLEEVDVLLAA